MPERRQRRQPTLLRWAPPLLVTTLLLVGVWGASKVLAAEQGAWPGQVGTQPTPTPVGVAAQPESPETPAELSVMLVEAMIEKDYGTLASLATADMRLVTWLSRRRVVEPDEVMQDLEELWLGPAPDPYLDLTTNLRAFFGVEPTTLWGEDWPVEQVLYVRGLAEDGESDALLAVVRTPEGKPAWGGILIAPAGFGLPPADHAALPTLQPPTQPAPQPSEEAGAETQETEGTAEPTATPEAPPAAGRVRILRTTNVYPAAEFDIPPVGLVRSGQEVDFLEATELGEYLRIACPGSLQEPCWIVNDPAAVTLLEGLTGAEQPDLTSTPVRLSDAEASQEITLGRGEFIATRSGYVTGAASRTYTVTLEARQLLYIMLASPEEVANFSLIGLVNGQPYKRIVDETRSLSFVVPVTQGYSISVQAPADQETPVEYSLTVVVLPAPSQFVVEPTATVQTTPAPTATPTSTPLPTPTQVATVAVIPSATPFPTAEPVLLSPGQETVELGGEVGPGRSYTYSIVAPLGSTLQVGIKSDQGAARFTVAGAADGVIYSSLDDTSNPFVMLSPRTQSYLITVTSSWTVEYLLTVTVSARLGPGPTSTPQPVDESAPTRLTFGAGEVSANQTSILAPYGSARFVVAAAAGQQATFALDSPDNIADFELRTPGGVLLKALDAENRVWAGLLPQDGDYAVDLYNPRGVRVQYTLRVTILPLEASQPGPSPEPTAIPVNYVRISFAAGEQQATVEGDLLASGIDGYVLRALAGQTMAVDVGSPQADVGLTVVSPDGIPLKRADVGTPSWSGVLPETGDYLLMAVSLGPDAPYQLTVRVTD